MKTPKRIKGHRLETISTRGGIMAGCTCGESYRGRYGAQAFETWDRDLIKARHAAHIDAIGEK